MRVFRRGRAGIFSRGGKLTARDGRTALMYACENGDIDCARLLVEKGADVNAQATSSATCAPVGAVSSDSDSAFRRAAQDPQSRVGLGNG